MLSEMAAEDIRYLAGVGVTLDPGQIVRLNDLALRVTRGAESADFVHAPRVAWAGDTPLYEPSIAAQMWIDDYALTWWHGASSVIAIAWACAHSRKAGFFDTRDNEQNARREIEVWQKTLTCTVNQLMVAVDYAVNGEEEPEQQESCKAPDGCPYTDMINEAIAANLGLSREQLAAHPRRILEDILRRWLRNQIALAGGKQNALDARGASRAYKAYDDYMATLTPKEATNV